MVPNGHFLIPSCLHFIVSFCYEEELSLPLYLSVYKFISMWTHGFLFYSVGIAIIIYLDAQIGLDLNSWSLFKLAWWNLYPSFCQHTFTFWHRIFLAHPLLSSTSPGISYFIKELSFLLMENDTLKSRFGARYAHYYWGIMASRL